MSEQSFEKAMKELEGIVEKLEEGGLSLNESMKLFEQGVKRARFLREELEKAEKKVEILLKDAKGDEKTEPFDLSEKGSDDSVDKADSDPEDNDKLPF
jgi:exodeoxyribonuclease VII small subunit